MRTVVALVLLCLMTGTAAASDSGTAGKQYDIDVRRQSLDTALKDLAQQTGLQIARLSDTIDGATMVGPLSGSLTARQALDTLLKAHGLSYKIVNERTIAIVKTEVPVPSTSAVAPDLGPSVRLSRLLEHTMQEVQAGAAETGGVAQAGVVSGRVTDGRSGKGLTGALVRIEESGQTAATDELGNFRFAGVASGSYTLYVSYLGYASYRQSFSLEAGNGLNAEIALGLEGEDGATMVVFGTRSARALALNQQRTAENSSEVVSADMLGNFTGTTISEALRRVSGVAFQRDEFTGDGANVIIRGMAPDMNAVKINGLNLPVGSGLGRSADLSNILADSVSKITVHKSLLPSHDSAGTGGMVEIETKSPLDRPRRYANFSAEGGQKGKAFGEDLLLSGTLSGTFGEEGSTGLSFSTQYRERTVQNLSYGVGLNWGPYLPLERDGSTSITSIAHVDPLLAFPFEPGAADAFPNNINSSFREVRTTGITATLSGGWHIGNHTQLKLDLQRASDTRSSFSRSARFGTPLSYQLLPVVALGGEMRRVLRWGVPLPLSKVTLRQTTGRM